LCFTAWPEFYDDAQKIWIPVDPTWANTTGGIDYFDKLDFNHIAFSSMAFQVKYPYPAGFYKKPGATTKDVQVQFADTPPNLQEGKLTVSYVFSPSATSGLPVKRDSDRAKRQRIGCPYGDDWHTDTPF